MFQAWLVIPDNFFRERLMNFQTNGIIIDSSHTVPYLRINHSDGDKHFIQYLGLNYCTIH